MISTGERKGLTALRCLRLLTACALLLSGILHVASLWLHQLSGALVLTAFIGGVYLFVALGLFGSSTFSLYLGALLPAAHRLYIDLPATFPAKGPLAATLVTLDWTVPPLCLAVLALPLIQHHLAESQAEASTKVADSPPTEV